MTPKTAKVSLGVVSSISAPILEIGRRLIRIGGTRGSTAGDNRGIGGVSEMSVLAEPRASDLRVFSPEEADPASGPATGELIPGNMRPGEAGPEDLSPTSDCGVPSI